MKERKVESHVMFFSAQFAAKMIELYERVYLTGFFLS